MGLWSIPPHTLKRRIYISPRGASVGQALRASKLSTFLLRLLARFYSTMLSPIPRCKEPESLRSLVQGPSESRNGECLTVQKPLRHRRKVDTVMANIEILVDGVVSKREAWGKSSGTKRRLPVCLAVLPTHALAKVQCFWKTCSQLGLAEVRRCDQSGQLCKAQGIYRPAVAAVGRGWGWG